MCATTDNEYLCVFFNKKTHYIRLIVWTLGYFVGTMGWYVDNVVAIVVHVNDTGGTANTLSTLLKITL